MASGLVTALGCAITYTRPSSSARFAKRFAIAV